MHTTIQTALTEASTLIEGAEWVQGSATVMEGRLCTVTAIKAAVERIATVQAINVSEVRSLCHLAVLRSLGVTPDDFPSGQVMIWNDTPGRIRPHVVSALRKAAAECTPTR